MKILSHEFFTMNEIYASNIPLRVTSAAKPWWPRLLAWLLLFVSGAVVGSGLTILFLRDSALERIHHPERMPAKMAARLRGPLDLTSEQVRQVEAILTERQQALAQLRRRVQPEVEAQLDLAEAQIGRTLEDRQRETWRRLMQHLRRTWLPAQEID